MIAWLKQHLDVGYGAAEWHRDSHVGVVVAVAYLGTLAANYQTLTLADFGKYSGAALAAFAGGCIKSYLTNNTPPGGTP